MKGYDLGLGDYLMEVDIEDENDRTEEAKQKLKEIDVAKEEAKFAKEEAVETAKLLKQLLEETTLQKQKLDEIPDTVSGGSLEITITDTSGSKAFELLERKNQRLVDEEAVWEKEKEVKQKEFKLREKELRIRVIKGRIKTVLILIVVVVVALAMINGYRIVITEGEIYSFSDVVESIKGIWESATDWFWNHFRNR